MQQSEKSARICWRLAELPAVTGLSLAYWRKVRQENKIPARRIRGGAVIVMHEDLVRYLAGITEGGDGESKTTAS